MCVHRDSKLPLHDMGLLTPRPLPRLIPSLACAVWVTHLAPLYPRDGGILLPVQCPKGSLSTEALCGFLPVCPCDVPSRQVGAGWGTASKTDSISLSHREQRVELGKCSLASAWGLEIGFEGSPGAEQCLTDKPLNGPLLLPPGCLRSTGSP